MQTKTIILSLLFGILWMSLPAIAQPSSTSLFTIPWDELSDPLRPSLEQLPPYGLQADTEGNIYINTQRRLVLKYNQEGSILNRYETNNYQALGITISSDERILLTSLRELVGSTQIEERTFLQLEDLPGYILTIHQDQWSLDKYPEELSNSIYPNKNYFYTNSFDRISQDLNNIPDIQTISTEYSASDNPLISISVNTNDKTFNPSIEIDPNFLFSNTYLLDNNDQGIFLTIKTRHKYPNIDEYKFYTLFISNSKNDYTMIDTSGFTYTQSAYQPISVTEDGTILQIVNLEDGVEIIRWTNL